MEEDLVIPVEKAQAEVLMIAGEEDRNWDSVRCRFRFSFGRNQLSFSSSSDMRTWPWPDAGKREGTI